MRWKQDLIKDIRYFDERDDIEKNDNILFKNDIPKYYKWRRNRDFSELNHMHLKNKFLEIKDICNCIVEIGVARDKNYDHTSTSIFLENKKENCVYLGIDIESKAFLHNKAFNVHTIQTRSENFPAVRGKLEKLNCNKIDLLMIDGWHSINQVLLEWEYTDMLSDNGLVVFHDTKHHPGPHLFIKNIDKNKWNVIENSCEMDEEDFGIGFVWKKT